MGGFGSGSNWMYRRKRTTKDCVDLDVNWLNREGLFDGKSRKAGKLSWSSSHLGNETFAVGYEVSTLFRTMRLQYKPHAANDMVDHYTRLTTTGLPWGGRRWWFTCPLILDGKKCEYRVGKLYLPQGARYFGCRHCYDLTYQSCQDSHRFDKLSTVYAQEMQGLGCNPRDYLEDWKWLEAMNKRSERNEQRRRRRKALNWS